MIEQVISANGIHHVLPPEEKVLVVFVHGLNGGQKSWNKMVSGLAGRHEIDGMFDIGFFNYPTSFIENWLKPLPNLQTISAGLKSHIDLVCKDYNHIILACHSMGGLICRKYMLEHVKYYKEQDYKIKSLLLYAVPNMGSDLQKVNFFNPWHSQISQLGRNSTFMEELNRDWDYQGLKTNASVKYIIAGRDSIVARDSAIGYWGNNLTVTDVSKSHFDIIAPISNDDISLLALVEQIKSVFNSSLNISDEDYGVKEEEEDKELEEDNDDL